MKLLFALLFFFSISESNYSQNRWKFANPIPSGFDYYDIKIDENDYVWICGEFGTLINSNDNFATWEQAEISITDNLYGIQFIKNKMWIVGENGTILFSDNYGLTYHKQISNTQKSLRKIQFLDENIGWIMSSDSLVLRTEDGGKNWQQVNIDYYWYLNDIYFQDNKHGYLLCGYYNEPNLDIDPWSIGQFLKTTDGGISWTKIDSGNTKYSSIYFLNDSIGYISIHNYERGSHLLKTIDSGRNWDTLANYFDLQQMLFLDEQTGFGISRSYLAATFDGGITWDYNRVIPTPSPSSRLSKIIYSNGVLYISCTEGNILFSNNLGNSWKNLKNEIDYYYASLRGVTFINRDLGFIYGKQLLEDIDDKPLLLSTKDAGNSWQFLQPPDSTYISKLIKHNDVYWVTTDNRLYCSEDNLNSWMLKLDISQNDDYTIRDFSILDNKHVIVLGGKRIYETFDGGADWKYSDKFDAQYLKQIIHVNDEKWYLLGKTTVNNHPNFITNNSGSNWNEINYNFTTMNFIDENIGYAIDSVLYKTNNGGNSWEIINEDIKNISAWTSRLYFVNEMIGWLRVTFGLYYTSNGGITWERELGINDSWWSTGSTLSIIDENEAWAVAGNGHIFHLSTDTPNSIARSIDPVYNDFILKQNYPNPFNPITTIEYTVPHEGTEYYSVPKNVKLFAYDILGNEIAVLVNEQKSPGNYEVKFDGSELSSGIYYYQLRIGSNILTKKMLLLK